MQRAIPDARSLSRLAGISRLRAEATALGFDLAKATDFAHETARDFVRGRLYGTSFAKQWQVKAVGETTRGAAAVANAATESALRRTAATENSEAFNSGRTAIARKQRESLGLLRVWDSENDKRRCPVCGKADGTIVGVREPFPDGEPGAVHSSCRCSWSLLRSRWEDDGIVIVPMPRLIPSL